MAEGVGRERKRSMHSEGSINLESSGALRDYAVSLVTTHQALQIESFYVVAWIF